MIKHNVKNSHRKKQTNKQKKNISPLLTSLPHKWPLQENSQSDKKTQFVLGLSLARVCPATWGQSRTATDNQGRAFLSPPHPCPEAEIKLGQ